MTCQELNSADLEEVLSALGHLPIKRNEKEAWFLNPFFKEEQASFKIDIRKNLWYLFSEGIGGTAVDFIMRYFNCSVKEALEWAEQYSSLFSFDKQFNPKIYSDKLNYRILEVKDLYSYPLKNYLKDRGLDSSIWKYVKEVCYQISGKNYFAIGFQNDSGGWELRNKFYKGSLLKKDITTLKNDSNQICVFEGFFDFLSFLVMRNSAKMSDKDYLILNSVNMVEKAKTTLTDYEKINLYLDNDRAGNQITEELKSEFPQAKDHRKLYLNHKDLNDFLIHSKNRNTRS